jgi:hypothetical protein
MYNLQCGDRGDQPKKTYQDKMTKQVFQGNAACGAARNITSRVSGWQEFAPVNG